MLLKVARNVILPSINKSLCASVQQSIACPHILQAQISNRLIGRNYSTTPPPESQDIFRLKDENKTLLEENKLLRNENKLLRDRLNWTDNKVIEKQIKVLQEENTALRAENTALRAENQVLRTKIEDLERELKDLKTDVSVLLDMYEKNELVLDTRELCGKIEDLILVDVFKAPESFESLKDLINAYRDQDDERRTLAASLFAEARKSHEWVKELNRYREYLRDIKRQGSVHAHEGRPIKLHVIEHIQSRAATTKLAFLKWLEANQRSL